MFKVRREIQLGHDRLLTVQQLNKKELVIQPVHRLHTSKLVLQIMTERKGN